MFQQRRWAPSPLVGEGWGEGSRSIDGKKTPHPDRILRCDPTSPTRGEVASSMRNPCVLLWSFAVDELHQAVLLRLLQASSFWFQVVDLVCGYRHGVGGDIVAVHDVLEREYEFAIHHPVAAEFLDQNRDIIFVGAIIIGARRQNSGSQGGDVRVPLVEVVQKPAHGISSKMQR